MGGQVVDTVTAEEFMQQVLQKISSDEVSAIAAAVERKSERFGALFGTGDPVSPAALRDGLRLMFGARRKADEIIAGAGADRLAGLVAGLLAPGPIAPRFDAFAAGLDSLGVLAHEVAAELLHFTFPDEYWLWTRWMWDPRAETGALRLVTMDEFELSGDTPGQTYVRVGEAVAFVTETGRAVGFAGRDRFGLDVFLACVYGIYMYTVLRMRMTQEFNHVVPPLPELARRLLGVHRMEE